MVGVVLGALYRPFQGILLQGGRPGLYTGLALAMILMNITLSLALIPPLDIYGAAVAAAATTAGWGLAIRLSARRVFGIKL